MTGALAVLVGGCEVARLARGPRGRWSLRYAEAWRGARASFPLSLSLPLAAAEHGHEPVTGWAWGLLPDNAQVLDRWARRFQVSAREPFALLGCVGEDCPGAVQIVPPERAGALAAPGPFEVTWLDEAKIAARLDMLEQDHAAWRAPGDLGWFSLAGAQPKTALLWHEGRWGVPRGRTPTTHILKPPLPGLDGHVENEHLCLALARELGLPAAASRILRFGRHRVVAVERWDRVRTADLPATSPDLARAQPVLRLHQEDLCQALGLPPSSKYQNEGGPGPSEVARLLRAHSSRPDEDVATFADALIYAWLTGGTDAHAKNYALLHSGGGRLRLAPLYDLASALPWVPAQKARLAMKVGGEYRLGHVGLRHWRALAADLGLDGDALIGRACALADGLRARIGPLAARCRDEGLDHPMLAHMESLLAARAEGCLRKLDRG